jgi:hypothetical protein
MKAQGGIRGTALLLPNLGARWGEGGLWSTPRSGALPAGTPGTDGAVRWMGPRAGLDGYVENRIPSSIRVRTPDHPNLAIRYAHYGIPAPLSMKIKENGM